MGVIKVGFGRQGYLAVGCTKSDMVLGDLKERGEKRKEKNFKKYCSHNNDRIYRINFK